MTFKKPQTDHPDFRVALEQSITRRMMEAHEHAQ